MEVILLENIRKLGKFGEVIEVKNGYGRNYLIPKGKAEIATSEARLRFEQRKAELEEKNALKQAATLKLIEKLEGQVLTLTKQAAEDGKLYGSVTARDIIGLLKEIDEDFSSQIINLHTPLKHIGEHNIKLTINAQNEVEITINVIRAKIAE